MTARSWTQLKIIQKARVPDGEIGLAEYVGEVFGVKSRQIGNREIDQRFATQPALGIEQADRTRDVASAVIDAVVGAAGPAVSSGGLTIDDEVGIDPIEDRLTIVLGEMVHGVSP